MLNRLLDKLLWCLSPKVRLFLYSLLSCDHYGFGILFDTNSGAAFERKYFA